MSSRAARMARRHKRNKVPSLSLTSLMDIFTILVFFLLVNTSQQQLPTDQDLALPMSTAQKEVEDNIVVMVTQYNILVQGQKIIDVYSAKNQAGDSIPELLVELQRQSERIRASTDDPIKWEEITIMGDKEIPYKLLRKLMFTCTESNFSRISLAVMKKEGKVE
jgi:biopolymer transport protein TolR